MSDPLADHVGRCNRENSCGYYFTPKQFFAENGSIQSSLRREQEEQHLVKIDFLPDEYLEKCTGGKFIHCNNFFYFLKRHFTELIAVDLFNKYMIGTAGLWKGAAIFPQVPNKPVCIVESEKTAIIASVYLTQFIWIATGGASGGCKWREYAIYKVLKGPSVTFFPDHGYYNKKKEKTCFQEWSEWCERIREALPGTNIRVSNVLENRLTNQQRQDQDLAEISLLLQKFL